MGLFLSAAEAWDPMVKIHYDLIIGRKGVAKCIELHFRPDDFRHLSGMHYANDIDFKLHEDEFRGGKLIAVLRSGKLDDSLIEKSRAWPKIAGRLNAVLHIKEILESDFKIYDFSPRKLPFHSKITAEYLLYSEELKDGIFLFFDQDAETYYCKSIFERDSGDYQANQSLWKVLKKTKYVDGQETVLFQHPNYKETRGQIL